ncbi:MAG: Error-prone DNA polymerase [Candidatus Thorarchaeota archaeon]|nr:MAG: Error-prone DNA polymerase [Candidatus Thorarchaeota archaeon]
MDRADLHTHSNFSDGKYSPQKIVELAKSLNLGAVALTDHDTLKGIPDFLSANKISDIMLIPGVEISTEFQETEFHILGYFPPQDSKKFEQALKKLEFSRTQRFPKMCKKLAELGISISEEEIEEELKNVTSPGRPHLARILVKKGIVNNTQDAFDKFLRKGGPAYVKKERMNSLDAIHLLRDEHAVPVIAHPLLTHIENLDAILIKFEEEGLLGVEIEYDYGKSKSWRNNQSLKSLVKKLGLIMTGGSDTHGDDSHSPLGGVTVSIDVARDLERLHTEVC